MSKSFYGKLLEGTGRTNKKVKSKYGEKILAMYANNGTAEGLKLGKNEDGMEDCVQISRREVGVGLGLDDREADADERMKKKTMKWNDPFWDNLYNANASKFQAVKTEFKDDSSSEEDSDSDSDIELEIIKATESYFKTEKKTTEQHF